MNRPAVGEIVIATQNDDKLKEIRSFFGDDIRIRSFREFENFPEVVEGGVTLEENAFLKARQINQATGLPALADDTGLEVMALDGAPGVRSSRYSGEGASYDDNVRKLLEEMKGIPDENRAARFRCFMAFVDDGHEIEAEGICDGIILHGPAGEGGFGYDPVFYVPELGMTFSQMSRESKNEVSHRGAALRKIVPEIRRYLTMKTIRN